MRTLKGITAGLSLLFSVTVWSQQSEWVPLFDGTSLQGWVQRGGTAAYAVEDGAIVGRSVPHSPNSFLCTELEFSDFVLEFEVKVDPRLNSGVQIRSHVSDEPIEVQYKSPDGSPQKVGIAPGRVYGYQVEIDPSSRRFSGGIYDESRRGWLYDLAGETHETARQAFRPDAWNHFKVQALGNSIQTWVNGIAVADLVDDFDDRGFLGLQVHSVEETEPLEVRWRGIRLRTL